MQQQVQWAEAVPKSESHCWLGRNQTGRRHWQGAEKQLLGSDCVWKDSSKTGSEQHCVLLRSVDQGDVLFAVAPWTHGSAHEKALTHDLISLQFSPRERSAIVRGAQTATVPLFWEGSLSDLLWRIPTWDSQDSRQSTWLANDFKVWLFSHNHLLHLLCAEKKKYFQAADYLPHHSHLMCAETSWSLIWSCLLPVLRRPLAHTPFLSTRLSNRPPKNGTVS